MSLALQAKVQILEERIAALEKMGAPVSTETPNQCACEARVKELENKYRMLNARVSRKE